MPFALLLGLAALSSGTLATYFYDRDAPLHARLCGGVCTGFTALGLVGFVLASFFGLSPLTLVLAAAIVCAPLALLGKPEWRRRIGDDMVDASRAVRRAISRGDGRGALIFYAATALLLWWLFGRVMYVRGGEVFTGVETNLGDLPFHISIITGFAFGDNFPPQHPEFSGVRLTYPFMVDFVAAMFVRAGASLEGAMFWQNFVLALALVGLLHRWAWKLTRDALAALITPALILLSGGFGWWMLVSEWNAGGQGIVDLLWRLTHDYTITSNGVYRWGNALTVLLIPQRGLLLGIPLALIVWTLWWQVVGETETEARGDADANTTTRRGEGKKKKKRWKRGNASARRPDGGFETRRHAGGVDDTLAATHDVAASSRFGVSAPMLAAGALAGLLPLVHAHSFIVMMGMGGCLALLFWKHWRAWAVFFAVALLIAAPQMFWATRASAVRAGTFFGWQVGWDHGRESNIAWFWLKNTGLFIPLLVASLGWHGERPVVSKRLGIFYLPFALCFVVPNLYKLSPWVWDNIKVIFYWWVASAPLVALLLSRLWREGARGWRAAAWRGATVVLLVMLTLAGGLDVWRVVSGQVEQRIFDRDGGRLAELIKRETPPRSLILHAPTYNHPVFLSGRRSPMGYAGHLWTHGLDYAPREADLRRMYAGGAGAAELIERYGIEYVVVSPLEQAAMSVNGQFFERYRKVGEAGVYRLYKTTQP